MPDPADSAGTAATRGGRLWFLASLPPPVNGQANCNAAMWVLLSRMIPLCRLPLGRSMAGKVGRALANGWALLRHGCRDDAVYISIPGQQGAWLLLPAIVAARLRGLSIWFHHHSFRSINRGPMGLMRALVACAGRRQQHLLLSAGMRDRFVTLYLGDADADAGGRAQVLSNTVLFPPAGVNAPPRSDADDPPTLGHLSVLTPQKGVLYLIDLFEELSRRVPSIRLVIAGPSRDLAILTAMEAAAVRHPETFEYRGAVAGAEKERFFNDIDLFVLPTTLVDEAEPLVVIEAYAHGVDVFATAAGCIPDRIRDGDFTLSLDHSDDTARVARAARGVADGRVIRRAACRAHVARVHADCREQGAAVLARLRDSVGSLPHPPAMEAMKADLP